MTKGTVSWYRKVHVGLVMSKSMWQICWPFQTHFHKFLRHWNSLIKKQKERNIIYTRFDCFHAHSLHENLHVSSCCLELLCSQYLVVVQVVIWSEPGDVVDLLLPPVGLGWGKVKFPS